MKITIYSGSFNPIHFGHLGIAKYVLEHTDTDELWLLVTPNNPLKDKHLLADENERYNNAKKAIVQINTELQEKNIQKQVQVSDFEFSLPKPNYTYNTLCLLKQQYPQHEFQLLIGSDNLALIDKWYKNKELLSDFHIIVYPRKGDDLQQLQQHYPQVEILFDAPMFYISSTQIRTKTADAER